jgi:hypothetical protein
MYYYIIKHEDFDMPFMVFAGSIADAVSKVMGYLNETTICTEEGIKSIERVDFDGIILF